EISRGWSPGSLSHLLGCHNSRRRRNDLWGCAASLKRILENQVSAASVNLTTETAIVWPVSEAKAIPNWQKELGINTCKTLRQIVA
ncbi:hypothetical protein EUGRSUZ_L00310, partial [Eucalyptus grandis]